MAMLWRTMRSACKQNRHNRTPLPLLSTTAPLATTPHSTVQLCDYRGLQRGSDSNLDIGSLSAPISGVFPYTAGYAVMTAVAQQAIADVK
jgi:hypothetical protein